MKYRYIASQQDGKVTEGNIDMASVAEVLAYLGKAGLRPISVKSLEVSAGKALFKGEITLTDQIFLTKYLALMLKIGTGLLEAVNILIADFKKPAMRDFLFEIKSSLEQGKPFYSAFARHPKVFSVVYINLVRAGEASGNLEKIFQDLTESLSKQKELRDTVKSAMVYPAVLFFGSIGILVFLVMYALPKIAGVFLTGGFNPPAFSKAVFAVGLFFSAHGFWIFGALGVLLAAMLVLRSTSLTFRRFLSEMFKSLPLVQTVIMKMALQRFASTLSSLIRAGMPLTESIEITATAVANEELKTALVRISKEGLARGLTVAEAFRRETVFPQTVVNLISISERAGHLEDVLATLADFYTKEIDSSVKQLVSFLEPAMLLFIGAIIGVIALAVIVPIYQLTTQF